MQAVVTGRKCRETTDLIEDAIADGGHMPAVVGLATEKMFDVSTV